MEELIKELFPGIALDVLIVCDGSGTIHGKPGGSAAFCYNVEKKVLTKLQSAFSHSTNNFAELFPILHALWYIHKDIPDKDYLNIGIVSDSENTVKIGQKQYTYSKNGLWGAVFAWEEVGYTLHWKWISRCSHPIHAEADRLSRQMRKSMENFLLTDSPRFDNMNKVNERSCSN